jgi:putative FmdB family regulatory protein
MPNYDYRCQKCGTFEVWQSIKDKTLASCPACGTKVERLISAGVGFVLKGSGFYQNDSKTVQARVTDDIPAAPQAGCGTCGSPDPCSSGNN